MREKRRISGMKKTVAVLAASLSFFGTPMIDKAHAKDFDSIASSSKHVCNVKDNSGKSGGFDVDFELGGNTPAITLSSSDPFLNKKLLTQNSSAGYDFSNGQEGISINLSSPAGWLLQYQRFVGATLLNGAANCRRVIIPRGVFIRPCPGSLYDPGAFEIGSNRQAAQLKTRVGGGTLKKVCEDLSDSEVTDIFLPFKVDDQENAPGCGAYGQLLYRAGNLKVASAKW